MSKTKRYTVDCDYYKKSADSIQELADEAIKDGMDLSYEILDNGKPTGEELVHYVEF